MPNQESPASRRDGLRLWPGVVIVLLQCSLRFGLPLLGGDFTVYGALAGPVGWLALVAWWLFFSRAPWVERLAGIAVMIAGLAVTWPFLDVSVSTGAMGALFPMLVGPSLSLAFVLGVAASRRMAVGPRWATTTAAVVLGCAVWALVRSGGFTGNFDNDLAWRWSPTPEERLLAQEATAVPAPAQPSSPSPGEVHPPDAPAVSVSKSSGATPVELPEAAEADGTAPNDLSQPKSKDWPGFRGSGRDSIVRGVRIETNWQASPPAEIWRRPIGPGWSSFSVHGDVFYTQEQRGEEEVVAAYRVSTGTPVWRHSDPARFWESNGGAGPRATPTLSNGRLYTFGATGILNALDAADGRVLWSRNVGTDSQTKVPDWGFSSSPVLISDLVVVAAAGKLAAYDVASGAPRWVGPDGGAGYSSPQIMTIHGVPQIVLLDAHGATSVSQADGKKLWDVAVSSSAMSAPIVQPAQTADGDLLIVDGAGGGMYRVTVGVGESQPRTWTKTERWMSTGLKPFFNDFVVHNGHAFGFDGSILSCIDLADGKRKWKGGRYGNGQMLLLADQDVLLVTSEEGDLVLVSAATDKFTELARVPAIEGKTWNHPVLVGDTLLVRNGEEMAAFRLALAAH